MPSYFGLENEAPCGNDVTQRNGWITCTAKKNFERGASYSVSNEDHNSWEQADSQGTFQMSGVIIVGSRPQFNVVGLSLFLYFFTSSPLLFPEKWVGVGVVCKYLPSLLGWLDSDRMTTDWVSLSGGIALHDPSLLPSFPAQNPLLRARKVGNLAGHFSSLHRQHHGHGDRSVYFLSSTISPSHLLILLLLQSLSSHFTKERMERLKTSEWLRQSV